MDGYVTIRSASLDQLRAQVSWVERLGAKGILIPDHLFVSTDNRPRTEARRGSEPLVLLAAIATISDRLEVGTSVSNIGFVHPALLLRQFAQLAVLIGGRRVLARLGAGWNREEFESLGMLMPSFGQRMERLEEAARLARDLFDHGIANVEGAHVIARDLPLAPLPETPPRLFLGGGSDRLLDIAGRYADVLDLNGTSAAGAVRGQNLPLADLQRRMSTTVSGLERSVQRVNTAAASAGRPANAVRISVLLNYVVFCAESLRSDTASRIRTAIGLPPGSLDDCPYVLIGEPSRMIDTLAQWRARFAVEAILVTSQLPRETAERLFDEVIARA